MRQQLKLTFLAVVTVLFLASCQETEKRSTEVKVKNVKIEKVKLNDHYQKFSYSGQLESTEKSF